MSAPFCQDRSPVKKPGTGSRTWRAGMPGKRQVGCRFLLGTSLLDKQKRSASPSEGGRNALALNNQFQEIYLFATAKIPVTSMHGWNRSTPSHTS
jgi:hypothetical protein